jgi:hypothetical protein
MVKSKNIESPESSIEQLFQQVKTLKGKHLQLFVDIVSLSAYGNVKVNQTRCFWQTCPGHADGRRLADILCKWRRQKPGRR